MSSPSRSNKRRVFAVFVLAATFHLSLPRGALAGIYSWKDEKGGIHFTDDLSKIPPQYRAKESGLTRHRESAPPAATLSNDVPGLGVGPSDFKERDVPLIPAGTGNSFVEVLLNGKVKGVFMVDTGASLTTISDKFLRKLGLAIGKDAPEMPFSTAGGTVWSPVVVLDSVKAGDAEVTNIEASVNNRMEDVDGLLGMNFLGEFSMVMEQGKNNMRLKPLGRPEDRVWGGKNSDWWKNKFVYFSGTWKQYRAMAEDYAKQGHPRTSSLNKLADYYRNVSDKLNSEADKLGVPAAFRPASP